jgi:hypothetical protein
MTSYTFPYGGRTEITDPSIIMQQRIDAIEHAAKSAGVTFGVKLPESSMQVRVDIVGFNHVVEELLVGSVRRASRGTQVMLELSEDKGGDFFLSLVEIGSVVPLHVRANISRLITCSSEQIGTSPSAAPAPTGKKKTRAA